MNTAVDVETVARWFLGQEAMSDVRMQRLCYYALHAVGITLLVSTSLRPDHASLRGVLFLCRSWFAIFLGAVSYNRIEKRKETNRYGKRKQEY